jgi:pimeloyl-ACP methyl ester carboxylesterase
VSVVSSEFVAVAGTRIAYAHRPGTSPAIVFLPGYMSDMTGSKAEALDVWAVATGRAFLRLDYSGCGASEGRFEDGTLSRWAADARGVIDAVLGETAPVVLVGSSMGGWLALLLAEAMPERVAAVVGIAAAPDFTDWGTLADLSTEQRRALARDGRIELPSGYGPDPYVYTAALIEDARGLRLLGRAIAYDGPVRLLHGQADPDVPWDVSLRTAAALRSADVQVILVKDGDHRLSRPQDLALLAATLDDLLETP